MKTPSVREKLTLRLPTDLHGRLTRSAVDNGRSLNSEIVQRLRRSVEGGSTRSRWTRTARGPRSQRL